MGKRIGVFISGVMAGCVFFVGASTSLAGGSFFIDDVTSFVGIGNTTPQSRLDVSGAMYSRLVTASSTTINWNQGNVQTTTLSSNPTLTFSNGQAGGKYDLILVQDGTGGRTVTWPMSTKWPNGAAPTLTSSSGGIDVVHFLYDGSNYLGTYDLNFEAESTPVVVAFDAVTQATTSTSYSHTTSGTDRFLVVYVTTGANTHCTATYNGTSLTFQAIEQFGAVSNWIQALTLTNPASGSHTLSIGTCTPIASATASYTGVSQTGQPEVIDQYSLEASGSSISNAITTTTNNSWVVVGFGNYAGTPTGYTNTTQRGSALNNSLDIGDSNAAVTPAGSYNQGASWSSGTNEMAMIQMAIAPAN